MKILSFSMVFLATCIVLETASAEEGKRPGHRREAGGKVEGQQQKGQGGPRAGGRDPAVMVARMMEQFDNDGDEKLDVMELTAMLTAMRERTGMQRGGTQRGAGQGTRRGPRPQNGLPGGKAGQSGEKAPSGRLGRGRIGGVDVGGQRPKRPKAE